MSHPPSSLSRSCLECRRRKIRCDRSLPCSYCIKVRIRCSYPPPTATSQRADGKTAVEDVLARIERVERALESFEQGPPRGCQSLHSIPLADGRSSPHEPVPYHQEVLYDDAGTRESSSRQRKANDLCPLFKIPAAPSLECLHPPTGLIYFIWQKYLESVDPVLKVFHAPTVQKRIVDYIRGRHTLDTPFECLMFGIYYAAVITMSAQECQDELGESKQELLARYRIGIESSLSKAKVQESFDLTVLQAFTIYLICGRRDDNGPDVRNLAGTAIGIALKIGLHRDGAGLGLPPFQVEMRRRLWWQIYILDTRIAEDYSISPRISELWFDTSLPSNVDDASLDPEMREPPPSKPGRTEMLYSLVRFEISNFARQVIFTDQFCSENCYPVLSVPQKCKAIALFQERIERQYLSHCDSNIPLDFLSATSSHLVLVKLKLTVSKPRVRQDEGLLRHVNFRKICVDILQRAWTLRNYDKGRQWQWLCQTYIEWDVLTCLLFNLSLTPKGDGLEAAWETVEEIYQYWKINGPTHRDHRWRTIEELRSKALLALEMIKNDPSRWEVSSDDNTLLEEPETSTAVSSPKSQGRIDRDFTEGNSGISPNQEAQSPADNPDVVMIPPEFEEPGGMLTLANAAAASQHAVEHLSHMESGTGSVDPPTSGTACQWSSALFETYFQVLGTEIPSTSWF